ncbi:MAG TPA: hypothetical protein DEB24_04560 [Coriobacteriia bacterium]|nr:hypothetical protein [Coriobacteriia bacterium]
MRTGKVPGCYISDDLLEVLQEEARSEDKGKRARLLRSAKVIAVARGLGYRGAHIGGLNVSAEDVVTILKLADEGRSNWESWAEDLQFGQPDGFYLYDEAGEMNSEQVALSALRAYPTLDIELSAEDIRCNPDYAFLRKNSITNCPKNQYNGPCGGGMETWCEMYPEKRRCVYVSAYAQLKKDGGLDKLSGPIYPPADWNT